MGRRLGMLAVLVLLVAGGAGFPPAGVLAKDLQQVDLIEALISSVVPKENGLLTRYSLPQFVGSRAFRNGRLFPFHADFQIDSLATILQVIYRLYVYSEIDMSVYPGQAPTISLTERRDDPLDPKARLFRTRWQLALFEGRPEPGYEFRSLWEEPFQVEMHVFDEREVFAFVEELRAFRDGGARFDLSERFALSVTPDIDPDGREYLMIRVNPFLVPPGHPGNAPPPSAWDAGGRLRAALEHLLRIPRFRKGVTPRGRDESIELWFQELRATTDPDGTPCWHIQGKAFHPKAVIDFVKDLRASGWFGKVEIDALTTNYLPGTDLLLSHFRMCAQPRP
ncbi:MAG: PilN domain-containing protein [Candidatus Riflebacteria bacterium]|nr:PilN domain-containing protein [Candidatus Riflebacteria bacterium]